MLSFLSIIIITTTTGWVKLLASSGSKGH